VGRLRTGLIFAVLLGGYRVQGGAEEPAHAISIKDPIHQIEFTAQNGVVCSQVDNTCTGQGPIKIVRGPATLTCNKAIVYFDRADPEHHTVQKFEAFDQVIFTDSTRTLKANGSKAVYDLEHQLLILSGNPVLSDEKTILYVGQEVVFNDITDVAVTQGRSTVKRDDKLIQADVFKIYFKKNAQGKLTFDRCEGEGNVILSTSTEIAKSDQAFYRVDTQMAELKGEVTITRVQGQLKGSYAVYDMKTGQGHIINENGKLRPVEALLTRLETKSEKHE
jgi:lipopolysaccharide export system protein LptA